MNSNEWEQGELHEIAEIIMGQSPTGDTCNELKQGYPLLNGPTEFGPSYPEPVQYTTDPRKFANVDDLLFCVRGSTTGRMNWANQRYAIGRGLAAIRHRKGRELQPFLKAVIDFNLPILLAQATGSTFPNVSGQQLKGLKVNLPSLTIQRRIASILSSLDDKIELNRQTNQTLEAIAQALFKEWFVDFNFPGATGEMQDSELGAIPKGWEVGKVKELCRVNQSSILKTDVLETVDYIEISEVDRGVIGNVSQYTFGEEPSRAKRKIKHGDVVLSTVRPNRGSYFLAFNPKPSLIVSTGFAVFTSTNSHFSFLYLYLTDEKQLEYYGHVADGGAYPAINPSLIMELSLVTPDKETLSAFHQCVEPILAIINLNLDQNKTLRELRDSLLPKLMKGEIVVNEKSV